VIHKFADLIERDTEILAKLESANTGKGIRICRYVTLTVHGR